VFEVLVVLGAVEDDVLLGGYMNLVPSQIDPPLVSCYRLRTRLTSCYSYLNHRGCFFRAAAGGAATGRSGGTSIGGSAAIAARGAGVIARTSGRGRGIVFISGVATCGGTVAKGIGIVFSIRVGIVRVDTSIIDIEFGRSAAGGGAPPPTAEGTPQLLRRGRGAGLLRASHAGSLGTVRARRRGRTMNIGA